MGRAGRLYVVATPIGNLGDLSPRVVDVLKSAAVVAAEDTRVTRRLLAHAGITTRLLSYRDENEAKLAPALVERLAAGESIALVSDAGTPCVSDPGYRLVRAAAAAGIEVVAVPGPSAVLALLIYPIARGITARLARLKESVQKLPDTIASGAKAVGSGVAQVTGDIAHGVGKVANQAGKGLFSGLGMPLLIGGAGAVGLFLLLRGGREKAEA